MAWFYRLLFCRCWYCLPNLIFVLSLLHLLLNRLSINLFVSVLSFRVISILLFGFSLLIFLYCYSHFASFFYLHSIFYRILLFSFFSLDISFVASAEMLLVFTFLGLLFKSFAFLYVFAFSYCIVDSITQHKSILNAIFAIPDLCNNLRLSLCLVLILALLALVHGLVRNSGLFEKGSSSDGNSACCACVYALLLYAVT